MGLLFTTSLLLNITLFCHIFSTYTLLNKELSLTSSQHIEPKFQLVKAANHIRNTINDEIQSFDDNFQVRFIIFIFFYKEIYIFIKNKNKNRQPGWGSGFLGGCSNDNGYGLEQGWKSATIDNSGWANFFAYNNYKKRIFIIIYNSY